MKIYLSLFLFFQFVVCANQQAPVLNPVENVDQLIFFNYPDVPNKYIKSINESSIETLKKIGDVVIQKFDVQNPLDFPNYPSMIFSFYALKDITGLILDVYEAKLVVKENVIHKNQSNIWEKECFVKKNNRQNYNETIKKTLEYLLNEYVKDAHSLGKKTDSQKIIFYYAE